MRHIITITLIFISLSNSWSQEWKTQIGQQVPFFEVENKEGKKTTTKELKGKVVLVNFFATWCPPCREELPHVQKQLWDKYGKRKDFEIIVLAREEGWEKLDPFLKESGYTFPFYPDLNRKVYGLFAENTIPRNLIFDREGKIIYQSIGYTQESFTKMVKLIEEQLKDENQK